VEQTLQKGIEHGRHIVTAEYVPEGHKDRHWKLYNWRGNKQEVQLNEYIEQLRH